MTTRSVPGYIGPQLAIRGRISGDGQLVVDGQIEGDVQIEGTLTVGASGHVVGVIAAGAVDVAGRLRGPVSAFGEVLVRDGGQVDGDVRAPRIGIDDGGSLHGGIDMDFELPFTGEGEFE